MRFGLRSFLPACVCLAVLLAWFGARWRRDHVANQSAAVIRDQGYTANYVHQSGPVRLIWEELTPRRRGYALLRDLRPDGLMRIDRFVDVIQPDDPAARPPDRFWTATARLPQLNFLGLRGDIRETDLARLAPLRQLQWLDLADCPHSAAGLAKLNCRRSLTHLDLTRVELTADDGRLIASRFPKLQAMALGWVDTPDAALAALAELPDLELLVLTGGGISSYRQEGVVERLPSVSELVICDLLIGLGRISNLPRLRTLGQRRFATSHSHDPEIDRIELSDLPALAELDLRARHLKLSRVPELRAMSLANCTQLQLDRLDELESLALSGGGCAAGALEQLRGCRNLRSVDVSFDASVTDAALAPLSDLNALIDLNVAGCRNVSDRGLASLPAPRLERLNLRGTGVTDAGVPLLAKFTQLRELDLRGTAVSQQAISALARQMPGLRLME